MNKTNCTVKNPRAVVSLLKFRVYAKCIWLDEYLHYIDMYTCYIM